MSGDECGNWAESPRPVSPAKAPLARAYVRGPQAAETPDERDPDGRAWFPCITEDVIATHRAHDGFPNDGASSSVADTRDGRARGLSEGPPQRKSPGPGDSSRKGEKGRKSGWFHVEEARNTSVCGLVYLQTLQ